MKVYINDQSIERQAESDDEALEILRALAQAVAESSRIAQGGKTYRTRELPGRALLGDISVFEVVNRISRARVNSDATRFLLETILRRPVDKLFHNEEGCSITAENGECLKGSFFDSAAQSPSGALTISAIKSRASVRELFTVNSSLYGFKKIRNLSSAAEIEKLAWMFDHNIKHRAEQRVENGVVISAMDLSPADAQRVLSNGVMVGNRVFGCMNEAWYQFHRHEQGLYHGFRVELQENNPIHMKARRAFELLGNELGGQVYAE